jgi:hypothetical protein
MDNVRKRLRGLLILLLQHLFLTKNTLGLAQNTFRAKPCKSIANICHSANLRIYYIHVLIKKLLNVSERDLHRTKKSS